jgi:membrane-bound lytic murein transglycosylase A
VALRRDFDLYQVSVPVLFTGYHEPLLHGSRVRTARFRYPIYRRPDDLVEMDATASAGEKQFGRMVNGQFAPYFSREDIDTKGVLDGRRYELLWVDDPVSLFFLHIQGSGQVILPDKSRVRVGYVASNGRPYRSIGKLLLEQGKLNPGEATTPAIRHYLLTHPTEQKDLLFANPRYIFFQLISNEGPRGSVGVPLTPGRSLATDPRIYPAGALGFMRAKRPIAGAGGQVSWKEFSRFVLFQDTGAAISGWRRADLFWGADAEDEAGLMAQEGDMFLVVKKP